MLRLTGLEKLMTQTMTQMLELAKSQNPGVSVEVWKRMEAKLDPKELIVLLIPLYDKYYTVEDLKAINGFYESSAGQKVLSTMPQLLQESMKIGKEWGERAGKRVDKELAEELKRSKEQKGL